MVIDLRKKSEVQSQQLFLAGKTTETLVELINTTTRVEHFLLASIERVALGAHIKVNVF